MTEQRQFHRIPFRQPASLTLAPGKPRTVSLLDISLHGVLLTPGAGAPPGIGAPCTVEIALGGAHTMVRMRGHVAHVAQDRVGVVCEHIDLDSITHLRRLVELNTGDTELLNRELEALWGAPGKTGNE